MKHTNFVLQITLKGEQLEVEINSSCYTKEDIETQILDLYNADREESDQLEEIEGNITVDVWDADIPAQYQELDEDLEDFLEQYYQSHYDDIEIWKAAAECDIQPSDVEEAYNGEFSSDEDFARDMAEQCGDYNGKENWPLNCIDWEAAAKELMYDYSEHNGHYFRNL